MNTISIKNVSLEIKNRKILNNINLQMEQKHVYGLIGNNGSGKTMLMKCICGFIKPTKGEIIYNGKIIGKDIDHLQNAGIIIEIPGFVPYYSGVKNLKLLASINKTVEMEQIVIAMKKCGLDPYLKIPVRKYSLGMRQRLGIAQAIMENQEILILDEPMNGLDKKGVESVRDLILKLKQDDKLILLTSHNNQDIDILCDEVYEMDNGEILNRKKCEY